MPTIRFEKIGDGFPAGDSVARFVTVLAMVSNDANRSIDELLEVEDGPPDSGARRMMLFRQQASFFFEAATFIGEASSRFPEVRDFIAGLPQEARDECAQVVGGIDPSSTHYVGDWLRDHRNVTFHYSEMHPDKAAHGKEEIAQALEDAAELPGTVYVSDELGGVRFWFADEVVAQWLPPDESKPATIVTLREALMALVRFTQRAFAAYQSRRPPGTFAEEPCQRWLACDPDRNWKLWMQEDHAARDRMRNRLRERAPGLYAAGDASLSAEQRKEAAVIADVRTRVAAELGDRRPEDRRGLEQRAALVGLGFVYDVLYRYGSSVAVHPTLLAVDLLYEKGSKGLVLRGEPTAQLGAPPVYLYGAQLLYEALGDGAEQLPALRLSELSSLGRELRVLAERYAGARSPNWPELLPSD